MHIPTRLICGVLALLAGLACVPTASAAEPAKNLLFFGNSYTYTNDIPGLIKSLAIADGHPAPLIVADLKGGANLGRQRDQAVKHSESNVAHPSMAGKKFDFVIIQGHSHDAFDRAGFIANARAIVKAVRGDSSGQGAAATAILYQTWAGAGDKTGTQKAISGAYLDACSAIATDNGGKTARIAPVGEAFALLKFDPSLYKSDGSHPSAKGSLLSAMIQYRTIYPGETVGNLAYADVSKWAGVSADEWTQLVAIADGMQIPPEPPASQSAPTPATATRPATTTTSSAPPATQPR